MYARTTCSKPPRTTIPRSICPLSRWGWARAADMLYSPSYLTDGSGDYYSVWKGVTAHPAATPPVCAWQADGTTCNWPVPGSGQLDNIDDLWHAAVDGGGTYFSATDPSSLSSGLSGALAAIASRKGSSAAAATSTLNPVAGNNYAKVCCGLPNGARRSIAGSSPSVTSAWTGLACTRCRRRLGRRHHPERYGRRS